MLIPREHGAYGQLLLPVVTGLAVGRPSLAAWALAAAATTGFLAHEGIAVLIGRRGGRALREQRPDAVRSVIAFGGLALGSGLVGFVATTMAARSAVVGTLVLAGIVMWLVRLGRERTVAGEVLVALTLSSWCVSVGLAAGAGIVQVLGCWVVWSATFAVATLGVRGLIARTRREPWRALCGGAVLIGAVAWWSLHRLALAGVVAEGLPLALAPAGVLGFASWWPRVSARHLHRVGWTIAAAASVTLALLFRAL